jgi:hypothetical protein
MDATQSQQRVLCVLYCQADVHRAFVATTATTTTITATTTTITATTATTAATTAATVATATSYNCNASGHSDSRNLAWVHYHLVVMDAVARVHRLTRVDELEAGG